MALVICAAIGFPALEGIVSLALQAAWAFGDSLLDVRQLLTGGKVPLVKTGDTWMVSLHQLAKITELLKNSRAVEQKGMTYQEYLGILLISASDSYRNIYRILVDTSSSCNNYYFDSDEISHTITTLARDVHDIYNLEDNYSYNAEEYFTDETNAALTDLRTQTKAILVAYAGLTPEEAEALPDLSSRKQKEYLERGLEKR